MAELLGHSSTRTNYLVGRRLLTFAGYESSTQLRADGVRCNGDGIQRARENLVISNRILYTGAHTHRLIDESTWQREGNMNFGGYVLATCYMLHSLGRVRNRKNG